MRTWRFNSSGPRDQRTSPTLRPLYAATASTRDALQIDHAGSVLMTFMGHRRAIIPGPHPTIV